MQNQMYPGELVESLVDELEGLIAEAKAPFGYPDKKSIDPDTFYNILDEIKMNFPREWEDARRIVKEHDELLSSAAQTADSIVADAQSQAVTIASETEIVRIAQAQADEIRAQAQQYERDTRYAAEDYANQVFSHLEENLKGLTSTVTRCRQMLNDSSPQNDSNNLSW